jgi:hypothetical protein
MARVPRKALLVEQGRETETLRLLSSNLLV